MHNMSAKISSKIILSHMTNQPFDYKEILKIRQYKIAFYNNKKEILSIVKCFTGVVLIF